MPSRGGSTGRRPFLGGEWRGQSQGAAARHAECRVWNGATELEIQNILNDGLKLSTYRFFSGMYSHLTMEEISARQVPVPFKEAVFSI